MGMAILKDQTDFLPDQMERFNTFPFWEPAPGQLSYSTESTSFSDNICKTLVYAVLICNAV